MISNISLSAAAASSSATSAGMGPLLETEAKASIQKVYKGVLPGVVVTHLADCRVRVETPGNANFEMTQRLFERAMKITENYFGGFYGCISDFLFANHKQLIAELKEGLRLSLVTQKEDHILALEELENWLGALFAWISIYKYHFYSEENVAAFLETDRGMYVFQKAQLKRVCATRLGIKEALEHSKKVFSSEFAVSTYCLKSHKPLNSDTLQRRQKSIVPLQSMRFDLLDLIESTIDFINDISPTQDLDSCPIETIFVYRSNIKSFSKNYYEMVQWLRSGWNRLYTKPAETAPGVRESIAILDCEDSRLSDRLKAIYPLIKIKESLIDSLSQKIIPLKGLSESSNRESQLLNTAFSQAVTIEIEGIIRIAGYELTNLCSSGEGRYTFSVRGLMRFMFLLKTREPIELSVTDIPKDLHADVRRFLIQSYVMINKAFDMDSEVLDDLKKESDELLKKINAGKVVVGEADALIPVFGCYLERSKISDELQVCYKDFLKKASKKKIPLADLKRLRELLSDKDLMLQLLGVEMLPKCFLEIFDYAKQPEGSEMHDFMRQLKWLIESQEVPSVALTIKEATDGAFVEDLETTVALGVTSVSVDASESVVATQLPAAGVSVSPTPASSTAASSIPCLPIACPPVPNLYVDLSDSTKESLRAETERLSFSKAISDSELPFLLKGANGSLGEASELSDGALAAVGGYNFDKPISTVSSLEGSATAPEFESYLQIIEQERARSLAKEQAQKETASFAARSNSKVDIVHSVQWDMGSLTKDLRSRKGLEMWLNRVGFGLEREGGRHTVFSSPEGETFAVPRHGDFISPGVAQQAKRVVLKTTTTKL